MCLSTDLVWFCAISKSPFMLYLKATANRSRHGSTGRPLDHDTATPRSAQPCKPWCPLCLKAMDICSQTCQESCCQHDQEQKTKSPSSKNLHWPTQSIMSTTSTHSVILPGLVSGLSYSSEPVEAHFQRKKKILRLQRPLLQPEGGSLLLGLSPPLHAFQSNSHYWVCIVDQEQHSLNIVKTPHRLGEESARERGKGREDRHRERDRTERGRIGACSKPESQNETFLGQCPDTVNKRLQIWLTKSRSNGRGGLQRASTTPTLRVLLLLRPTVPHAECLLNCDRKRRGGFSSNPLSNFFLSSLQVPSQNDFF